jgi:hypothetical protein
VSGDEEAAFGMVMPFMCVESVGGPYADGPFVAGVTLGAIDRTLNPAPAQLEWYVPTRLVSQLDLSAMRYGWRMEAEPWDEHPDEWTFVRFTRAPSEPLHG